MTNTSFTTTEGSESTTTYMGLDNIAVIVISVIACVVFSIIPCCLCWFCCFVLYEVEEGRDPYAKQRRYFMCPRWCVWYDDEDYNQSVSINIKALQRDVVFMHIHCT